MANMSTLKGFHLSCRSVKQTKAAVASLKSTLLLVDWVSDYLGKLWYHQHAGGKDLWYLLARIDPSLGSHKFVFGTCSDALDRWISQAGP